MVFYNYEKVGLELDKAPNTHKDKRSTKGHVHGMCSWHPKEPKKESQEAT